MLIDYDYGTLKSLRINDNDIEKKMYILVRCLELQNSFLLFFISSTEHLATLFSEVTELAEIAHEVIFYLNDLHFVE